MFEYAIKYQLRRAKLSKLKTIRAAASELFNILDIFLIKANIQWKNCVGICTDGARAMCGIFHSLQVLMMQKLTKCIRPHCLIRREGLADS